MSDIQNAIRELSTALEGIELPHDFLENYDPLECLSHRHGIETYLVQQKCSTLRCIVKCYDRKVYTSVNESNMLKSFCHKGLPHFMDEFRDEAAVCVVREYVTGLPLDKYIAEYKPSEAQIVTLCVKLCDILIYLHGRQPPLSIVISNHKTSLFKKMATSPLSTSISRVSIAKKLKLTRSLSEHGHTLHQSSMGFHKRITARIYMLSVCFFALCSREIRT